MISKLYVLLFIALMFFPFEKSYGQITIQSDSNPKAKVDIVIFKDEGGNKRLKVFTKILEGGTYVKPIICLTEKSSSQVKTNELNQCLQVFETPGYTSRSLGEDDTREWPDRSEIIKNMINSSGEKAAGVTVVFVSKTNIWNSLLKSGIDIIKELNDTSKEIGKEFSKEAAKAIPILLAL